MSARRAARVTLLAALLLGGCAAPGAVEEGWVFAVSREAYSHGWPGFPFQHGSCDSTGEWVVFAAILVLPLAIDTVLLPVTVPHDIFFQG